MRSFGVDSYSEPSGIAETMGPTDRDCLIVGEKSPLDVADGEAVLALARCLRGAGLPARVLAGAGDAAAGEDLLSAMDRRGWAYEIVGGGVPSTSAESAVMEKPRRVLTTVDGVPIEMPYGSGGDGDGAGAGGDVYGLFLAAISCRRPGFVVLFGCGGSAGAIVRACRERGIRSIRSPRGPIDRMFDPPIEVDACVVHSRAAAGYATEVLGLRAEVLPMPVDCERIKATGREPRYLTFLDPTPERGVFPLARIAEECGRRRPDIPILIVEGEGTEATLAGCGLDLTARGNVSLMSPTSDPRKYWRPTKLLIAPRLAREDQPADVVGALINGIPVIGSDRGGLPETLGEGGIVLPLPERLTPATRALPTPEEVAPWVEAVIRLWDDDALRGEYERKGRIEARRWSAEVGSGLSYNSSSRSSLSSARIRRDLVGPK